MQVGELEGKELRLDPKGTGFQCSGRGSPCGAGGACVCDEGWGGKDCRDHCDEGWGGKDCRGEQERLRDARCPA